ncbi:hypothetical protein ZIOFF_064795 [Zingiber officinale]|uniref:Uncharacterized protein n=1 Tax=Zingiber officinale TaxID=94328 RepID=A0A8J5EWH3_ZINOF|nr:hypothetical protein ZIOFF_064795 [Zingiber officinale]
MGQCYGKSVSVAEDGGARTSANGAGEIVPATPIRKSRSGAATPVQYSGAGAAWPSPYPQGSASPLPDEVAPSPARSTPRRIFGRLFPPPSPAKHIKAALAKRQGPPKPRDGPIPEDGTGEGERPLDKSFGYSKNFGAKYELGNEVGRGHFGHTCSATAKKGSIKGQLVAVKIISKAKVRWEVVLPWPTSMGVGGREEVVASVDEERSVRRRGAAIPAAGEEKEGEERQHCEEAEEENRRDESVRRWRRKEEEKEKRGGVAAIASCHEGGAPFAVATRLIQ